MSQRRVYIFVLYISGAADETVIQMAFSADMYYLIFRQKFRKQCADGVVDGNSTQASADDHNDGLGCGKSGIVESGQTVTLSADLQVLGLPHLPK